MKKILIFTGLMAFHSCASTVQEVERMNGLSFVASPKIIDSQDIESIKSTNANYVAIMPFGFLANLHSSEVIFNDEHQWWGEKIEGCEETIRMCKEKGLGIMLKPQIWVGHGEFTGKIDMSSEEDWLKLESSYGKFILTFAKLAEKEKVELLCVGTELERFVEKRPAFWHGLIKAIKTIYKGKLTYAENWDCFDRPAFLKELDYVGVDAYFPLSDKKNPSKKEIRGGWERHISTLEKCFLKEGKPILFTECGYRSVDFAGAKPWDFQTRRTAKVNEDLQARLLEVLFEIWQEEWMAGGFIWKWFPSHHSAGGPNDNQFSPQNKKAQNSITQFWKKIR